MKTPEQIRELIAVNRWRPIEEAPKDECIVIKTEDNVFAAQWVQNFVNGDIAWAIARLDCEDGTVDNVIVRNPTHWKPIPTDELADVCEQLLEENERLRDTLPIEFTCGKCGKKHIVERTPPTTTKCPDCPIGIELREETV